MNHSRCKGFNSSSPEKPQMDHDQNLGLLSGWINMEHIELLAETKKEIHIGVKLLSIVISIAHLILHVTKIRAGIATIHEQKLGQSIRAYDNAKCMQKAGGRKMLY
ncbi:hypothetical protein Bca4012_010562 [Brassica carinata]